MDSSHFNDEPDVEANAGKSDSSASSQDEYKQMQQYASKETMHIRFWRMLVGLSILGAGAIVATFTHRILYDKQVSDSRDAFILFSNTIEDSFTFNVRSIFEASRTLSRAITTAAMTSKQTFPYVAVPAFEVHGFQARTTGIGVENVVYAPIVSDYQEWIHFSQSHSSWIEESKKIYDDLQPGLQRSREPQRKLDPVVWQLAGDGLEPWKENGIFIPSMHVSPPPPKNATAPQNVNLFTFPDYKEVGLAAVVLKDAVFSSFLRQDNNIGVESQQDSQDRISEENDDFQPRSIAAQPVYKDLGGRGFSTDVGGYIFMIIAWENYLVNLLPEGVSGIILALRNTCDQSVTYEVDGRKAHYIGEGDLHDQTYNSQRKTITFSENYIDPQLASQLKGHCEVFLDVYPSRDFETAYLNSIPIIFTSIVIILFVIMAALFVLYDRFVDHRNTKVLIAAARSNAIVSSLFPSHIRDRLMAERKEEQESSRKRGSVVALKGFLSDKVSSSHYYEEETDIYRTKPIAELYPETTIFFGDLAGFTAWSSAREPVQVFTLLETIYHSFDQIARKYRVFKVETIGDCYVAVCGLPDPQKDHAVRMARFARECMHKSWEVTEKLEVTLGPDTGDLTMRMGLHSGPVTAGVLRGEGSRFQLFGDTMNTASRMESTGVKSCIQLSLDTADLLVASGLSNWVRPREDKVFAKGKGEMQTFFLELASATDSASLYSGSSSSDGGVKRRIKTSKRLVTHTSPDSKTSRLVSWNVEILSRVLKQIVARRKVSKKNTRNSVNEELFKPEEGRFVLDEVAEIITLPNFDAKATRKQECIDSIDLPAAVIEQLEDYITQIGMMYHDDNPFHNFNHATHVTQSVVKLLSRIVAPSNLDFHGESGDAAGLHDHTYGITSDPLTQFSCILSALIHDVDHPGVPNAQLVKEHVDLAEIYRGKSIAEQNSVNIGWNLLMDEKYAQLRATIYCNDTEMRRFRQLLVNSVMATDIVDKELKLLRNSRWAKAFSTEKILDDNTQDAVNRKATIVIEHLIQASDVAHTMQHWHVYRKWNELFFMECYKAFKMGRGVTDPLQFWYKGELGFFDFYIIPLARKLKDCGVFGVASDEYLNYAIQNRQEWESRGLEIVQEMAEKAKEVDAEMVEKAKEFDGEFKP